MIPDDAAVEQVFPAAISLAADETKRKELENRISEMAFKDSAMVIAQEVLKLIKERE